MLKKGKEWSLTGAVDLGELVNDLEAIKKKLIKMKFRWPVTTSNTCM